MTNAIEAYLDTILIPQLEQMAVQSFPEAVEAVLTDIHHRLQSLLSRWHDTSTRKVLLFVEREEGAFYEPRSAPLEIRALVVVAIGTACSSIWGFRVRLSYLAMSQSRRSPCKREMFSRSRKRRTGTGKPSTCKD